MLKSASSLEETVNSKESVILFSSVISLLAKSFILLKYKLGFPNFVVFENCMLSIWTVFKVFSNVSSSDVFFINKAISVYWYKFCIVKLLAVFVL